MKKNNLLYKLFIFLAFVGFFMFLSSSLLLFLNNDKRNSVNNRENETTVPTETENKVSKSLEVTNITDSGFTVIWISESKEIGYIMYGSSINDLTEVKWDERDNLTTRKEYYVHSVSVSKLQSETNYYFVVYSGDKVFNNEDEGYMVTTFPTLSSPSSVNLISGKIENLPDSGEAIIVIYIKDQNSLGSDSSSSRISTLVDEDGGWVLSLGDSRVTDGTSYFKFSSEDIVYMDVLTTITTNTYQESIENAENGKIMISL